MVVKVVIAEDDSRMQLTLKTVLEKIEEVKVIETVGDGISLIKAVEELKPDVIFVDIEMPEMDGLTATKEIVDIDPRIFIIFVTGFAEYSLDAFDVYAFDYLIKPFKIARISKTMDKIKKLLREKKLAKINEREIEPVGGIQKLVAHINQKLLFLDMKDVIMLTRYDRKTYIYVDSRKVLVKSR